MWFILKNAVLPVKSVFVNVKKGISELGVCWAAKHATENHVINPIFNFCFTWLRFHVLIVKKPIK